MGLNPSLSLLLQSHWLGDNQDLSTPFHCILQEIPHQMMLHDGIIQKHQDFTIPPHVSPSVACNPSSPPSYSQGYQGPTVISLIFVSGGGMFILGHQGVCSGKFRRYNVGKYCFRRYEIGKYWIALGENVCTPVLSSNTIHGFSHSYWFWHPSYYVKSLNRGIQLLWLKRIWLSVLSNDSSFCCQLTITSWFLTSF